MEKINIMVNGAPGNMAVNVILHALSDDRFNVIPMSLTGPEIDDKLIQVENENIELIHPTDRDEVVETAKQKYHNFITVDYTHPSAVNGNAQFYCSQQLPFVMGTTGGNREILIDTVEKSTISAVIAPNMAKQIVGFQAMMEYAANTFPNLFHGYDCSVKESHQKGKADTSGTAKAIIKYFKLLGLEIDEDDILKVRDPDIQENELKIPKQFLTGHGWHTYTLTSNDKTVLFQFKHNVNGRDIYSKGTLDAIYYLNGKIKSGAKGIVFNMIDVLKGK